MVFSGAEKAKRYRLTHPDVIPKWNRSEKRKKWLLDHADEMKEYWRKYYIAKREKKLSYSKNYHRRKQEEQFGVKYPEKTICGLCLQEVSGSDIRLDHNHITGEFRGWLHDDL